MRFPRTRTGAALCLTAITLLFSTQTSRAIQFVNTVVIGQFVSSDIVWDEVASSPVESVYHEDHYDQNGDEIDGVAFYSAELYEDRLFMEITPYDVLDYWYWELPIAGRKVSTSLPTKLTQLSVFSKLITLIVAPLDYTEYGIHVEFVQPLGYVPPENESVPDGGTTALLLGSAVLGFTMIRRRRRINCQDFSGTTRRRKRHRQ